MFISQRDITDKILFDYYMVGSIREEEIYTQIPYYIDRQVFNDMVQSALVLDKLVRRVISSVTSKKHNHAFRYGDFLLHKNILNLEIPLPPFFWVRFDAFQREDGGVFFSEFNYDKPCAQREIAVSALFKPDNDPNCNFEEKFRNGFDYICRLYSASTKDRLTVAILIDPSHYEEVHLAHLYTDLLQSLNYDFIIAGGKNLEVKGERLYAFDKEVDILLRQYPTEYLHEIEGIDNIMHLINAGKILMINDPRSIIGQSKNLFAYLWELVENDDPFLSEKESNIIKSTVPYTRTFCEEMKPELLENKDKFVLKAAFGRYSEEVYIGNMHTDSEWEEVVQYICESEKLHIVQEFCLIKQEKIFRYDGNACIEQNSFGNFGIYLINGEFSGTCVRWSGDYLSSEDNVCISSLGLRDKSFKVYNPAGFDRDRIWNAINSEAAFKWGYTGGYTGTVESFMLQALILDRQEFNLIKEATEQVGAIFKKTTVFVQENSSFFCPVLGISDTLSEVVTQQLSHCLTYTGRCDWVFDSMGRLKLLEFNSETPAGLLESFVLNGLIKDKLGLNFENPNENMAEMMADILTKIVENYSKVKDIKSIGIVSSSYYEDWYNTMIIYEAIKHLPFTFILGEVSGLEVKDGELYLYEKKLDALYRYYPLDWFDSDPYYANVINTLKNSTLSINPPATFINQSKAFFALIWELSDNGFYDDLETDIIKKYIPKTALSPNRLETEDYCIKPYFGREGQEVVYNIASPAVVVDSNNCVFQERIDIQSVKIDIYSTMGCYKETRYPVIGSYIFGDKFGGIYTRAGSRITDKYAVYMPTFINNQ